MPNKEISKFPDYTPDLPLIIEAEQVYIQKHRETNNITGEESGEGTWGICFSSGGIGASIMTLGVIQALMKKDFFRRIDYMSTVSAGGFIPTCLTSLLTGARSSTGKFGVGSDDSPFISKLPPAPKGKLPTARQQLNHLKRSRGFLPDIASKTSTRNLLGVWFGGWAYGFFAFLVLLFLAVSGHSAFLYWFSDKQFFGFLQEHFQTISEDTFSIALFRSWGDGIWEAWIHIRDALVSPGNGSLPFLLVGTGFFYTLCFLFFLMQKVRPNDHDSFIEKRVNRFEMWGYIAIYSIIFFIAAFQKWSPGKLTESISADNYWLVFGYAPAIALGIFASVYLLQFVHYVGARRTANYEEIKKAFHGMHGAGLAILIVAVVLPILYIISTLVGGWTTLISAFVLFILGLYFNYQKAKTAGMPLKKQAWVYHYLSNLAAVFIVILFFSTLSKLLLKLFLAPPFGILPERMIYISFAVSAIMILLLIAFSQTDRSNLHYYIKDKLSSAFLFTEARNRKGHLVNLRNDALLKLHEIGHDNYSGPYHIINASVNVHKSEDPDREQRKGLPYIFSKYYVGSEATHYVKTNIYKGGKTKLIDAQANSTAFLNTGMGIYSFAAQSFLLNALNCTLGAWVENPLYYRDGRPDYVINYSFLNFIKSAMGRFDERSRYVNLSEGDHSGDNFGLIPLLQRKCDHIIICDFTVVHDFFLYKDLFAQTNALSKSYGVTRIEIDCRVFDKSGKKTDGYQHSASCIQFGTVYYDSGESSYLYYLKAVLDETLPKNLKSYAADHPRFPSDLWPGKDFDESDYQAYRLLGVHLGKTFLKKVREDLFSHIAFLIDERIRQLDKELELVDKSGEQLLDQKTGLVLYLETLERSIQAGKLPAKEELEGLEKTEIEIVEKLNYLRLEFAKMAEGALKFQLKKEIEKIEEELLELRVKKNELVEILAKGSKDIREKQSVIQKIETIKPLIDQLMRVLDKQKQQQEKIKFAKEIISEKRLYLDTFIRQKLSNLYEPLPEFKKELKTISMEIENTVDQLDKGFSESVKSEVREIRQKLNELIR